MQDNYEWDTGKTEANCRKHGVRFSDAASIFEDPNALTIEDQDIDGEKRLVTIGLDCMGRLTVVVYVYRGDRIRLISARRANRYERVEYESR